MRSDSNQNIDSDEHILFDGEVKFWLEQESSIHLKAATKQYNDPVELTAEQAREVGEKLILLADKLTELDNA